MRARTEGSRRKRRVRHLRRLAEAMGLRAVGMAPMDMRTFLTPSRGPSSLRGALAGGGALLSGLRSPPPRLPPPRYKEIVSLGEVN
jgi:hypothetical protein